MTEGRGVEGRSELRPRAAVVRMKEYHPPLGQRGGLRLDFNENTVECSPKVLEALRGIGAAVVTKYPERGPLEALAAEHLGVRSEELLLTNGVDEAIHVLCQAFVAEGEEVLLPVPTYSMYEVYASSAGARVVAVAAEEEFRFPLQALLDGISAETRLVAIANPNSPTGTTLSREAILRVAERAPHAAVLVDEAYFHFFGESVLDLVGQIPNLFVARTFSKAYGLAGLRLGAIAGADQNMHWLRRVISPYSVNSLALAGLKAALEDSAYLEWYVSEVKGARAQVARALDGMGMRYWPSQANFFLVEIGPRHREFVEAMRRRDILVRDRSADQGCDGCVRITIGTREQMRTALARMAEGLAEMRWSPEEAGSVRSGQ